ncbi:hypothetical protein Taro_010003 [Colocasia esculenta]|uniref:Uncharacterized protein n=1 Tax=Colocasia esculenta TaxID=4460 RepID=A0A843UBP7_COLES|nr:hypothetical protein [Colocasia esculenta]
MVRKRLRDFYTKEAVGFLSRVVQDKPLLPFLVPLVALAWAVERWLVPFSNWVPLAVAVWATIQYGKFQRQQLVEDLNKKWKQLILNTSPMTPLEPCEWLNKLLLEVWPNFMDPMLSRRFSSIEKIELQDFSLGSSPPTLGTRGVHWFTSGEQRVLRMGFTWDTNDMSIMLYAKLASPLIGTARIVINSIHIKGDLLLMPILDGQALLYSFESSPEVRVGVVFGSGGSQSLPATELPGVSTWLVKLFTDTLVRMMVEPRRGCFTLPAINLRKKATGCEISVTAISASKLIGNGKPNSSESRENSIGNGKFAGDSEDTSLQTFIEVEIEELTRRTNVRQGSSPGWDDSFNMVLHGESGIIKFHLYEWHENGVKFDYLSSCEIKIRYVEDDSTIFWAIGPGSSIVAKRAEYSGKEVQMVIPFEGKNVGELSVKLAVKQWQYSDGSKGLNNYTIVRSQPSVSGSQLWTGRKFKITIIEGRNLLTKSGKCDPYVKLQYGKTTRKTKTLSHAPNPVWNQSFEFDELGDGEYLRIRCYTADMFGDDNIGSARVNLEGLVEGSVRDVWIPLEKVNTGELRLQIEVMKNELEGLRNSVKKAESGWIELVIIEAKDLIAADLRGTSDPYVRVQYGNLKKRTKVSPMNSLVCQMTQTSCVFYNLAPVI